MALRYPGRPLRAQQDRAWLLPPVRQCQARQYQARQYQVRQYQVRQRRQSTVRQPRPAAWPKERPCPVL
ncbi:hypothetical protein GCM10027277_09520 [Pseudoduganella ginsengisoli]